jgi:hypothetical protein
VALLAGSLLFVVSATQARAGCNPPGGSTTELETFIVNDTASLGNSATATAASSPNPGTLYICEDATGKATIEMSATKTIGDLRYVGWRIEKTTGRGTSDTDLSGTADPNQGKVDSTTASDKQSTLTVSGAASVREFYVKAFCDGDMDGKKGAGEDYYSDSAGVVIEVKVTVVKVEAVSVDATDDVEPTKINYTVLPSGATISSVTFTAPGMTETRANVSGSLCFTFNQTDLASGNNAIRLSYLSCETDITANKEAVSKGPAEEIVIASYPENQEPPTLVNISIIHKIIAERYWRITYSGATVVTGSCTLHVGSTDVRVEAPEARTISWVLEKHRYHDTDGDHREQVMSLFTGTSLP